MAHAIPPPICLPIAEHALLVQWENRIDPLLNDAVQHLYRTLSAMNLPGLLDLAPAYSSLALVLDLAWFDRRFPEANPLQVAQGWVESALKSPGNFEAVAGRLVEIPVCYEGDFAPDLERPAAWSGMEVSEIIAHHTGPEYRVYLIGFLPGFAYMGTVDARLAAPRLARPRERVPAGSVGIAGLQTGVYPLESPGGWNLIGRTPLRLFDPARPEPVLLRPGDRVRFRAIGAAEFHQLEQTP